MPQTAEPWCRFVCEQPDQLAYEWDISTGRVRWGGAIESVLGYQAQEFLDVDFEGWARLLYPADKPAVLAAVSEAAHAGRPFSLQYRLLHKDGSFVHVEERGVFLKGEDGRSHTGLGTVRDITARRQAEDALRESERHAQALFDQTFQLMALLDVDGTVRRVNATALDQVGVREEDVVGRPFWNTPWWTHDAALQEKLKDAVRAAANGECVRFPVTHRDKTGNLLELDFSIKPFRDEEGNIRFLIPESRDVSELKRTEEALELAQFSIDNAADQIFWVSPDARFVYVNEAACLALGYAKEQLLAMTVHDIDVEMSPERWAYYLALSREKGAILFETRHRKRDGRVVPVEIRTTHIRFRDKEYLFAFGRDISERRKASEALRDSEETARALLNATSDAAFLLDRDGKILTMNRILAERFSRSEHELVGSSVYDLLPEDIGHSRGVEVQRLLTHRTVVEFVDMRDGAWYEHRAYPILDAEGNVSKIAVYSRDITERKNAEKERKRLEEQLQQSQKMESIGRLVGGIAHDFNNLLTGISGNIRLAMLDLDPNGPVYAALTDADEAASSATALTRQLLAFSRKQIIEPKVLDLNGLVEHLRTMLIRLIGEDVQLQTSPADSLWRVKADPSQIEQALINLVVNGRDAMPNGGRLSIKTSNVTFDDRYCRGHAQAKPGDYVMISVSDTGCGMTEDVKAHLFEPFFTTKPKGKGTGLGLATVYGMVRQNQGAVEVYSEAGIGTTFKIYLPRIQEEIDPTLVSPSQNVPTGNGEIILMVEDEASVRSVTHRLLTRLGYEVLPCSNGEEALATAKNYSGAIDMLMTDVVMPGINGRVLAAELTVLRPALKVLFTSGYTDDIVVDHGILEEGVAFLGKPYTPEVLAQKLREVLEDQGKKSRKGARRSPRANNSPE